MFCSRCGQPNKPDALVCENCGSALIQAPQPPWASQAPSAPQPQPPWAPQAPFCRQEDNLQPIFQPIFKPLDTSEGACHSEVPYAASAASNDRFRTNGRGPAPGREPARSHKKLWIVLATIIIVLALIGGMGFAFRRQIMKTVTPEQYLQLSIAQTFAGSFEKGPDFIDFSKFAGKAVSHSFSVDADEGSAEGTLMYDSKNEKALLTISAGDKTTKYNDNTVFISPDMIAFSLPDLIKDTNFLSIDPATFKEDCEASGWTQGAAMPDLQGYIHLLFGKSGIDAGDKEFSARVNDLWTNIGKKAEFSSDGSVQEEISGTEVKLDVMSYALSKYVINDAYHAYIAGIHDGYTEKLDSLSAGSLTQQQKDQIDSAFDQLDSITFEDDLVIHFYIDMDGNVRKINVEDISVTTDDLNSPELSLGFEMVLGDGDRPADDITAAISLEAKGDTTAIVITSKTSVEDGIHKNQLVLSLNGDEEGTLAKIKIDSELSDVDGIYTSNITLSGGSDNDPKAFFAAFDCTWDRKDASGENLDVQLTLKTEGNVYADVTVKGALQDSEKETSLSDATLEVTDQAGTTTVIDFSYGITLIDPSDITVDTSDCISLFEYEPFLQNLASGNTQL